MSAPKVLLCTCMLLLLTVVESVSGPLKIHIEGTLTAPDRQPTFDGKYPVVIRLWNGAPTPILTVDTVRIDIVKGVFKTHIGPFPALTRETFSTKKSLSFQFPHEPEHAPRTPLMRMAASGEIYCYPIKLTTSSMPSTDAGTRVRLGLAGEIPPAVGILLSMTDGRIELLDPKRPGLVEQYQFDSIRSFEISSRYRSQGQLGFLAGIVAGGVAGYAMGSGEEDDLSMSKETKRAFDAFAGAILGGLTGYLLGNSVTVDRWQTLPLDRVRDRMRDEDESFVRFEK